MIVKRVGGGYGAKISRSSLTAAACALGAHATGRLVPELVHCLSLAVRVLHLYNRPVRMHMSLETNMENVGKRFPFTAKYSVSLPYHNIIDIF